MHQVLELVEFSLKKVNVFHKKGSQWPLKLLFVVKTESRKPVKTQALMTKKEILTFKMLCVIPCPKLAKCVPLWNSQ